MLLLPDDYLTAPIDDGAGGPAWWFVFSGDRLLVDCRDGAVKLPFGTRAPCVLDAPLHLGRRAGVACYAAALPNDAPLADGLRLESLRRLWGQLDAGLIGIAGQALQVLTWDREHHFCGACGTPTQPVAHERARRCPACGVTAYPRISPAMMVRVTRGDEILLARAARFAPGFFSVLAGFVDPGESLEQCLRREVREEVGLEVKNLRYFDSQSWPFPHSLMLAFSAEWAAGEITIDGVEIVEAGWFRREAMPDMPSSMSIARRLIDDWLRAG